MGRSRKQLFWSAVTGCAAGISSAASPSLISDSPFLPPNFSAPSTAQPAPDSGIRPDERYLEFRGVYKLNRSLYFNIHDRRSRTSEWVGLNDSGATYKVVQFDETSNEIRILVEGDSTTLSLKEAPPPSGSPVRTPPPPARPATTERPQVVPSPANNDNARDRRIPSRRRVIRPRQ